MTQEFSDEIDLRKLARSVRDFLRSNIRILAAFILAGAALGLAASFLIPPRYESQMTLQSDILKDHFAMRLSDNLSRLIEERNYAVLGERLSLTKEEARTLRSIEIETVVQPPLNEEDEEVAKMTITARVTEVAVLPKLQVGLVNYMRNLDFVKIRVRQREAMYKALIDQLDHEIRSLDSLKATLLGRRNSGTSGAGLVLIDPTNIYAQLVELNKKEIEYKNSLELYDSIQIMEGFTPFEEPVFPKIPIMLLLGSALGLAVGLTLRIGRLLFIGS